jgi:hypothetical protein
LKKKNEIGEIPAHVSQNKNSRLHEQSVKVCLTQNMCTDFESPIFHFKVIPENLFISDPTTEKRRLIQAAL